MIALACSQQPQGRERWSLRLLTDQFETLERIKWYLWHGNVFEALYCTDDLEWTVEEVEALYPKLKKLKGAVREFRVYLERNGSFIPNYGERWRYGETISTAIAESTVNAVVGKRFSKRLFKNIIWACARRFSAQQRPLPSPAGLGLSARSAATDLKSRALLDEKSRVLSGQLNS